MYRGFVYNTPPPVPAHPTAVSSSPSTVVTASQQQPAANSDFGGASNADANAHGHTSISFYEGQSFANFQQFKVCVRLIEAPPFPHYPATRGRERESERQRQRQRERDRDRDRKRERRREREGEREWTALSRLALLQFPFSLSLSLSLPLSLSLSLHLSFFLSLSLSLSLFLSLFLSSSISLHPYISHSLIFHRFLQLLYHIYANPLPIIPQSYRLVPMYRGFVYNTPPPVPAHPTAVSSSPSTVVTASQQQPAANSDFGGASNADANAHGHTSISFYEGQSFANFQQFKVYGMGQISLYSLTISIQVLWDRYLSDTQTMVQKRSSKTGHDATYFPYKHVLYVCFYYGKDRSASANWREMDDPKAASNRKCRFKLRLHFDTKVGRGIINPLIITHNISLQRQSYAASRSSYAAAAAAAQQQQQQQNHQLVPNPAAAHAAIPAAVVSTARHPLSFPGALPPGLTDRLRKDDELLKAHSILRTHPLSSLTQLQHQSLDRSASANWREMDDPKAASNRKCRFKLRLHFDTKVGRYRITKYNGSHSNHQLGKVQVMPKRQSYAASRSSYAAAAAAAQQQQQQQNHQLVPNPAAAHAAIPAAVVSTARHPLSFPGALPPGLTDRLRKDDELLKAHSILRTHPLSSLTQLQHQSLGQDILFWQSNSMRELAETNPRLLSLSTLYPVAKEDFVLHLFYAHKDEDKYLVAWTFINCAVQRSAEIALTIFARFNPVTQKQAELVVMNHSIEWVASAINIFCKAIFHLSLDNVHEHLQKRLHSSCDWERIENGAEKLKNCLDLLERVVYAKNECDYAINLKELELAGPASFLEYFYNNWNNKKDFWVYYIQQRTAEALKSSHLEKQESKIENFLTINRKSLTYHLLESQESKPVVHLTPSPADIKPNIVHHSPAHGQPPGNTRNFGSVSPSYDPPSYNQGDYKREKRDSDDNNPGSPNNENTPSNAEYSPEYGVADRKFGQWKNGDYQNNSNSPRTREGTRSGGGGGGDEEEGQENTQDCSGSEGEEESSPVRQSTHPPPPQFPVSRSSNYPAFNPALFPPTPVSPQFLPRHTFMAPPGSFPAPYLHSGSRDFPALTRPMFPPTAHAVPGGGRDAFNQSIHTPPDREDRSASANWREMDDPKAASNRKCRFKLRLHFDTKVGRYRITKYNGSHSNHQLGKVQVMPKFLRRCSSRSPTTATTEPPSAAHAAIPAAVVSTARHPLSFPGPLPPGLTDRLRKDDELLKAHSILRTHPLSSLTQLQHQSLGQDILFWQSNSMRELAETNPRLLSLSTLYPVAKEDFVLHLFYAHKDEDKYLVAWTFINCAVQRSAEIALTIFARFNPVTQKQAELVVMNHSIEWVASAINIFCKAIFHLSLDNVHEHLQKRLHSSCDWERIENGAEKLKNCLDLLERVVYAKNECDYAINLKELELAGPASFLEYFYNNWNNKKDFWVYYIQQRTAEALKSSHLEKQESKIENFLTINRKSLTSCISLLMLFGEAPDRLNAHLSLLESQESKPVVHLTPSPADIKPNIVHHSPAHGQPPGNTRNFGSVSPSYDPPSYNQGDYKREKRDSDDNNPGSPNNENTPSNAEYSPEYGVADRKFGQWKNGDYQNNSNSPRTREGTRSGGGGGDEEEGQENTQDCSGSEGEEESSPVRQSNHPQPPQFPVSRSSNYPAFNPALFPPTPVSPQFLPRHTFMAPPGSFPAPYLHSGSRDFPALTRPMFPPTAHAVPGGGRDAFNQSIHTPPDREGSPFTRAPPMMPPSLRARDV
eukprot:sb/3460682/